MPRPHRSSTRSRRWAVGPGLLLPVMLITTSALSRQEHDNEIQAVAGARMIWLIENLNPGTPGFDLCLIPDHDDEPRLQPLTGINQRSLDLAAWGDQLWIVYPRTAQGGRDIQREVYSLAARPGAAGVFITEPRGQFTLKPPLPARGRLVDIAGTPSGLVALLLPPQRAAVQIDAGPESLAATPVLRQPSLQAMQGGQWVELPLPEDLDGTGDARIVASGPGAGALFILTWNAAAPEQGAGHWRNPDGEWSSRDLSLGPGRVVALVHAAGHVVLVQSDRGGESCRLSLCRPGGVRALGRWPTRGAPWRITGGSRAITLLRRKSDHSLEARRISPVSGRARPAQPVEEYRRGEDALRRSLVPALLLVLLGLGAVLIRKPGGSNVRLNRPHAPLPLGERSMALLLDLIPGAVISMLILGCGPAEVLRHPILGGTPEEFIPFVLMIAMTTLISGGSELWRASTVGKAIFGAKVIAADGSRPSPRQILIRNVLRLVLLILPPLAVFMFRNPYLQGLHDLRSKTVVVHEMDEASEH